MTRTRSRFAPSMPALAAFALAAMIGWLPLGGCETIAQDIDLLAQNLLPPTPREAAEMMVDPHDPDRRREGTLWIANAPFGGAEAYLPLYREMAETDPDPTVRAAAIRALARHGTPEDATLIAAQLRHPNDQVRWEAARGLQRLHNPAVISELINVLRDRDESADTRVAAAHALGQYPRDSVFQVLISALDARELWVNETARRSLVTLTGRDFGYDAADWLGWYNRADPAERFAGGEEYRFQTYQRDETLFERMAFWTSRTFEQPAQPAGLRPRDERRTYENDNEVETEG